MLLSNSKDSLNSSKSASNFQLESNQDSFNTIEGDLRNLIKPFNLNQEKFGEILVSLTEAITNAVRHGNKFDASKHVAVEFVGDESRLYFRVSDEGNGFDYDAVPDPTSPENILTCGGRGVHIMKALADELNYSDSGRTVELEFDI
ncbi:MAG: ATP-binding protein [Saprospiraceae bacterium]|nr:ATP-binding protein [Saprospiraceae bacterium]